MNKIKWEKIVPHVVAVVLFFCLTLSYNSALLDGNRLVSHDDTMYRGAAKEINDYRKNEKEEALWTNNMFSGMPAYTISYAPKNNLIGKVFYAIGIILPTPAAHMFWSLLCFYIMLLTFGFKPWASIVGAVAYGFCSYNIGIIVAGHYAKLWAIAFFPLIVAGINLLFKKKYLWGALLTGVATSVEILVNHPQMTYYYFVFFLSLYLAYLFIRALVQKEFKHALIAGSLSAAMILIGVGSNANKLLPTNEYAKYSTRAKSDLKLSANQSDQTSGLDRTYIVGYSSGRDDIYSFLIPNYKGYNSGTRLVDNPKSLEAIGNQRRNVEEVEMFMAQNYNEIFSTYWGTTDLAGAGVYSSVIIFALFLLGFIFVKHPVKWLIIPAFLCTLFLSWGKNYMSFTNFFIDHFPMYNKFRAVNSIIIVITFCVPLLGSFLLARLVNEPEFLEKKITKKLANKHILCIGLGVILLSLLCMYASPKSFQSFMKPVMLTDQTGEVLSEVEVITQVMTAQQKSEKQIDTVIATIEAARISIFKADALRSFVYLLLASIAIVLYAFKKIKWPIMIGFVGLLVLIDLWTYDQRFLSKNTKDGSGELVFQPPATAEKKFTPSQADQYILNDKSIHKRVLNLAVSPFNDGTTSYYHQSLGGYSGAKMKRYQELIEKGIYPDINIVYSGVNNPAKLDSVLAQVQVLNMLNTKYFIFPTEQGPVPVPNRHANGAAWTVSNVKFVEDADVELGSLKTLNTKTEVVIDDDFKSDVNTTSLRPDSTAKISMTKLSPRLLEYDYVSSQDQFVVFSEIYYPAGWKAYIDGNESKIIRVNYVLRGLSVPKGQHKIEFMFEPESYKKGENYSLICSGILMLMAIGGAGWEIYRRRKVQPKK